MDSAVSHRGPKVGLFATCLVDLFRPNVGFATAKLLQDAGCEVDVPVSQTCCGQPAYNNGDQADARAIAQHVISIFENYDYVVAPSGSCAGMLKLHYPKLFAGDPQWQARAQDFAGKSYELISFMTDVLGIKQLTAYYAGKAAYHDSCSGLRELGIKQQPRNLLANIEGLVLVEMQDTEVCCGFGGTFCVKYPELSTRLVSDKAKNIMDSGADTLFAGDMGCLLNIAGRLSRLQQPIKVYHIAEVLAGMTTVPPIGVPVSSGPTSEDPVS